MSEYYHIVPWYDSEEWRKVNEKIFLSSLEDKLDALNLLKIWKARCPALPSGIESTLTLLEVYVQDINSDSTNNQLLRLAYSSAIMRYINHMLDTETAKGASLYRAAKILDVPDWIIDLRHDIAHNDCLPSIDLLREAANISLSWLKKNYWDRYSSCINDYISGQLELYCSYESKISVLINLCISLSICAHPEVHIRNLADIPNDSMRESIVNDVSELFGGLLDMSNLKTVSLTSVINLVNVQCKKILKGENSANLVNTVLLREDSIFLSIDALDFVDKKQFYKKNHLCSSYIKCFEFLLTFLHTNNLILDFILELVKITQNNDCNNSKRKLAALWLAYIFGALNKCKQLDDTVHKSCIDKSSKTKHELKSLYFHWFPNEKTANCMFLDLHKPVPLELMDINYMQTIISSYNPYLSYFIKNLLCLIHPSLPQQITNKICKLAELITSPEKFPVTSFTTYTVEDLRNNKIKSEAMDDTDSDCVIVNRKYDNVATNVGDPEDLKDSIWRLASSRESWFKCPIGQVPWKMNENVTEMQSEITQ